MTSIPRFGENTAGVPIVERPSAYAVMRDLNGAIAVVRTPKGHHLPGGGIDEGESPEQTVIRETREEAGLRVSPGREFARAIQFVFSLEHGALFAKNSAFIAAEVVGGCSPSECDHQLLWLEPEEAVRLLTHESHKWAVQQLLSADRPPKGN